MAHTSDAPDLAAPPRAHDAPPTRGRRERPMTPPSRTGPREKVASAMGGLLLLGAVWSLIGIFLAWWAPVDIGMTVLTAFALPVGPSLFTAVMLASLAGPIRRRYRAAHTIVAVLMVLVVLAELFIVVSILLAPHVGVDAGDIQAWEVWVEGAVTLGAIASTAAVIWARPQFTTRLSGGAPWAALRVLLAGLAASFVVTTVLTFVMPRTLDGFDQKSLWALRATFGDAIGGGDAVLQGHRGHHWIYVLAGLLSALAVLFAARTLWRAEAQSAYMSADDELAVRELLLEFGEDDSLGYFATRRDKSVVFSPDRRAAVAFRPEGSVSVASGDPVGDPTAWAAAIDTWLADTYRAGRYPAVLAASQRASTLYVARGLSALTLGDEAVLDADSFSLSGRSMKQVRHAVGRVRRAGYTAQVRRYGDLDAAQLAEITHLADAWRGEDTERGFSMALGRVGDPADDRCVLVTAHDANGAIRGLLSFAPWGRRGLSLDLMRRSPEAVSGVTEFMVASLMDAADGIGLRRVSLNFAMFRRVFSEADQVGADPITRLTDRVLTFFSRYYQIDSLYRSNEKYGPEWVPRLLCYDPALTLARAGVAVGRAEGFVPEWTALGRRRDTEQRPRPEPDFVERVRAQEEAAATPPVPVVRLNEQQRMRRGSLDRMEAAGRDGYPVGVPRDTSIAAARAAFDRAPGTHDADSLGTPRVGDVVSVVGRVRALRDLGGVTFAVLQEAGVRLQVVVAADVTAPEQRADWRHFVRLGDQVSVTGELTRSRRGEPSIALQSWVMASKCLNPLPDLHARLSEDARTRQRTLDLITHPTALRMLQDRSRAVLALREQFVSEGYLEVETPMLQAVHGGASARPFTTHINAYDTDLYLRIAPELFLKRLMVGGMERIFEVGRNFRNEGADATHNPEFTSVEAYCAFGDYNSMRELTRRVILAMARAVHGREVAMRPDGQGGYTEFDLSGEWPVVTLHDAVARATGETVTPTSTARELYAVASRAGVEVGDGLTAGHLVMELYEALVEKQTVHPTFYTDFPVEVSPLARPHRSTPGLTEQWDLVGFGAELGTAYSELIDPVEQRDRLTRQSMAAAAGDPEAMQLDEDFLDSLAYGMPPTGGLGIGVDRVVMMLLGQNIRATLTFPFVKPL